MYTQSSATNMFMINTLKIKSLILSLFRPAEKALLILRADLYYSDMT